MLKSHLKILIVQNKYVVTVERRYNFKLRDCAITSFLGYYLYLFVYDTLNKVCMYVNYLEGEAGKRALQGEILHNTPLSTKAN